MILVSLYYILVSLVLGILCPVLVVMGKREIQVRQGEGRCYVYRTLLGSVVFIHILVGWGDGQRQGGLV